MAEETTSSARQPECKICKKTMKTITNTHLKKHNLTKHEYMQLYPDAFLGSCSWLTSWRNSEENKRHLQKQAIRIHSDPTLHNKQQEAVKKARQLPSYREALSKAMKAYANTPEGRSKLCNKTITTRMKLSNFERWVEDYGLEIATQKQLEWQQKNILPSISRNTKIELLVQNAFRTCGYSIITQLSVPHYYCDIYVPEFNLIVEVNGDYWHANPKKFAANDIIGHKKTCASNIWKRDEKKVSDLQALGYNVAVVWESDIKNSSCFQLVEDIVHRYKKL